MQLGRHTTPVRSCSRKPCHVGSLQFFIGLKNPLIVPQKSWIGEEQRSASEFTCANSAIDWPTSRQDHMSPSRAVSRLAELQLCCLRYHSAVYPSVRSDAPLAGARGPSLTRGRWPTVSRNVVLLGLTSLFTDISSEMLTAVLPLYFMLELRMTPLQFGLIDGLYQGTSAIVRVASGWLADAGTRYKAVATTGYALSAVCKVGLLAVGCAWTPITGLMMLDRLGKGIRTAPRDALITLSSDSSPGRGLRRAPRARHGWGAGRTPWWRSRCSPPRREPTTLCSSSASPSPSSGSP